MQKWQLMTYSVSLYSIQFNEMNIEALWEKDRKTQKTSFDVIEEFAAQGWELVSVTL